MKMDLFLQIEFSSSLSLLILLANEFFLHLQSYKPTWKSTHNHFQRYSDVKPREERRSTVVDLANQTHVIQKVNGWKIYHLTSQMEDLVSDFDDVYSNYSSVEDVTMKFISILRHFYTQNFNTIIHCLNSRSSNHKSMTNWHQCFSAWRHTTKIPMLIVSMN